MVGAQMEVLWTITVTVDQNSQILPLQALTNNSRPILMVASSEYPIQPFTVNIGSDQQNPNSLVNNMQVQGINSNYCPYSIISNKDLIVKAQAPYFIQLNGLNPDAGNVTLDILGYNTP